MYNKYLQEEILNSNIEVFNNYLIYMSNKELLSFFNDESLLKLKNNKEIEKINLILNLNKDFLNKLKENKIFIEIIFIFIKELKEYLNKDIIYSVIDYYKNNNLKYLIIFFNNLDVDTQIELIKTYDFDSDILGKICYLNNELFNYLCKYNLKYNTLLNITPYKLKYLFNSLEIPNYMLFEENFIKKIVNINDVKNYRLLINELELKYDCSHIEKIRKRKYNKEIYSYNNKYKMLDKYYQIYKLYELGINNIEEIKSSIKKYFLFAEDKSIDFFHVINDKYLILGLEGLKQYLMEESNLNLSDMIIDYHFEDIPYNLFIDLKRLIKFQKTEGRTLGETQINLYKIILNIDNLSYEDKIKLHEYLNKINCLDMYYDDYCNAKYKNFELIKNSILDKEKLKKFYREDVSSKLNVPVYVLDGSYFCCLVKSLEITKDNILNNNNLKVSVDGSSFSLDGSTKLKTFYDPRENYNLLFGDFDPKQVIHLYPVDSYSHYKRNSKYACTTRVFEFATPTKLLNWGMDYNEIIIACKNSENNDELNNSLINPTPIAIYCYDVITENDIISAKRLNLGIVVVKTKEYKIENNLNGFDQYDTIYNITGYKKEYEYITLESEDNSFNRRK